MYPILFTIYIDELLLRLKSQQLGFHIGHMCYADDVILIAPTLFSLRIMLDVCRQFSDDYDVKFNSSKSKLLVFGRSVDRLTVSPIKFMDNVIELVPHESHLGNMIGQNCNRIQLHTSINEFNAKVNMINSHFHYIHNDILYKLFKTYCMPLYGSQLWDHSNKEIRKLFDLPYITHCDLLLYICDDCPPNEQLYFRVISLCKRLANTDNNLSRICYAHAVSGSGSSVSNTISVISS